MSFIEGNLHLLYKRHKKYFESCLCTTDQSANLITVALEDSRIPPRRNIKVNPELERSGAEEEEEEEESMSKRHVKMSCLNIQLG